MNYAPVIFFVYNRPEHTKKAVEALQQCELSSEIDLYIFSDGPRENDSDDKKNKVTEVRNYLHSIEGFHSIHIDEAKSNRGCANSIIYGVSKVIEQYGTAIVVEDDIVVHPFFLRFMNDALSVYKKDNRIFCVSATTVGGIIPKSYKYDLFASYRTGSWGWATWKDRWKSVNWDINSYSIIKHPTNKQIKELCKGGDDLWPMLNAQLKSEIDAWDIRWLYNMSIQKKYCLYPVFSFASNNGMDGSGTHCGNNKFHFLPLYSSNTYNVQFPSVVRPNKRISHNIKATCDTFTNGLNNWKRMRHFIKKLLFNRKGIKQTLNHKNTIDNQYCYIHPSCHLKSFNTRFDNPIEGKTYLSIGKDSIVSGNFIFESTEGFISIGEHCYIGGGTFICRSRIEIGNNVTIAWGGTMYDHDSHSINYINRRKDIDNELEDIRNGNNFIFSKDWSNVNSAPITICDDAWIGMNVIILKGCTVGEGAIVGAGSVVTHDIPAWTMAAGNPAKIIKKIDIQS